MDLVVEIDLTCPQCDGHGGGLRFPTFLESVRWTRTIILMCYGCGTQARAVLEPDGRVHEEGTP
jgi:hypothetical protein